MCQRCSVILTELTGQLEAAQFGHQNNTHIETATVHLPKHYPAWDPCVPLPCRGWTPEHLKFACFIGEYWPTLSLFSKVCTFRFWRCDSWDCHCTVRKPKPKTADDSFQHSWPLHRIPLCACAPVACLMDILISLSEKACHLSFPKT